MANDVDHQQQLQNSLRTAHACRYCKRRKIKCSGTEPCTNCTRRRISCTFDEVERKVLVSERYLLDLERGSKSTSRPGSVPLSRVSSPRQINQHQPPHVPQNDKPVTNEQPQQIDSPEQIDQNSSDAITNPLVSHTSTYIQDDGGRYRFLGSSSTWTFSQRVLIQLRDAFPENQSYAIPMNVDDSAYRLDWTRADSDAPLDTSGLPSIDYTLYLMNAVKFHTCQMFRPFDEEDFTRNLYEFHEQGLEKIQSSRLWFVQFLLIVALGKAMVIVVRDPTTAPGSYWFQRAMAIMPDFVLLQREPKLAVQVLCLVTLYLVSIDMKEAAYGYIGQAVRICLVEGLHRETPRQVMGDKLANHYRDIWWTVYILDRRLSSMIGAPSSLQDVDITCPLPSFDDHSQRGTVLNIHVKISRLMTQILNSVYSVERLSRPFVKIIQSVLRDMAVMAQEMDAVFTSAAFGSIGAVSTVAGHINLSYHQCILLATRPLLLHIMIARLNGTLPPNDLEKTLLPQTKYLLDTCLQSARTTLKILLTLYDHHLIDSFLPFDLESLFSSAFIVTMASAIIPSMISDAATWKSISYRLMDYLIRKGDIPAQLRKKELLCLDQMILPLVNQTHQHLTRSDQNPQSIFNSFSPEYGMLGGWTAGPGESGLSPSQMLNIADQLETQALNSTTVDRDWAETSPWAWWNEHQIVREDNQFSGL